MAGQGTISGSEPIVYIDHSDIREGSLDELKVGVSRLVDFIQVREPQLITYGFYIDDEAGNIGRSEFRKVAHLLTLTTIECYGRPSERVMELLRQKAAALGDGGTVVSVRRFAGFANLRSATT
jgi:hypothetical protein